MGDAQKRDTLLNFHNYNIMNWYKLSRTKRIDPEDEPIEASMAEAIFGQSNIRTGRKDISHVAIENNEVIGGVSSGWEIDNSMGEPIMVFSFDIAIDKSHRRKGVGKSLIADAVQEYKNVKNEYDGLKTMMRLWVINKDLVPYLESIGFSIENEYKDGSAHMVMY